MGGAKMNARMTEATPILSTRPLDTLLLATPPLGVWQRVAMDSLEYLYGPPCQTPLLPAGGQP